MEGVHILVGFKDSTVVVCTLGGELTPLPESGRRSVWASVAQVIYLFLYTLHALKTDKQVRDKKLTNKF